MEQVRLPFDIVHKWERHGQTMVVGDDPPIKSMVGQEA